MRNQLKRTSARALKSLAALVMIVCLLAGSVPMAFAGQAVGTSSASVDPSETKVYVKLSKAVSFFTGEVSGTGTIVKPAAGTVCQLVSDNWYTGSDNKAYYSVYYLNKRYNVLKTDVAADVMTAAQLETYITGTLWKQKTYATLRKSMGLVGDIRVHAVQLALQKLGYYKGNLDGNYGKQTHDAVARFQREKGLDADGSAGPLTQPVLFALASGSTTTGGSTSTGGSSTGSTSTSTTGTLRTIAQVNLRKYASTESARLAIVPRNINLSFTDTYTNSKGITWYQVRYAGENGWVMGTYVTVTSGGSTSSGSSGSTTTGGIGTLRTNVKVNLRKYASTGSARLGVVPSGMTLSYTDTYVDSKNITWYQVRYGGETGWLMGTFVTASGSSSGSTGSTGTTGGSSAAAIGKVTITKPGTRIRDAANGKKTGYVLSKGTVVDLLSQPTSAGGYTWYHIRTSAGITGYVRGDCATANIGSSSDNLTVSAEKTFIKLPANTVLFTTETKPTSGGVTVAKDTVLMMYSAETYTVSNVKYCSLYYNNQKYNAVYSEVSGGIMTTDAVASYVKTLLGSSLPSSLKRENDLVGDVRVYALQVALEKLGYYTGKLDGTYGAGTQSAVRNFQRAAKIEVDGACGNETWAKLNAMINGTGNATDTTITDFGTVTSIEKASWDYGDNGAELIPKRSYATVLDVRTGKVFQVFRWSGGSHADCVPASTTDTKTMCDIVGFTYNSNSPTSSQLEKIKAYAKGETDTNYTWPDFGGHFGGRDIGADWDRRPALIKVNGSTKAYAVSIYGFPHGFTGDDSFSRATFPNGQKFYAGNNYYGMMCIHFVGSRTHTATTPDEDHQKMIDEAYKYAQKKWPELCK